MHLVHKVSSRFIVYISLSNIVVILIVVLLAGLYNFKADFREFEEKELTALSEKLDNGEFTLVEEQLKWIVNNHIYHYARLDRGGERFLEQGTPGERAIVTEHYTLSNTEPLVLTLAAPFDSLVRRALLRSIPYLISLVLLVMVSAIFFQFLYSRLISRPLLKIVDYLRDFSLIEQGQRFSLDDMKSTTEDENELNRLAASINEIGINLQCSYLFLKETNEKLVAEVEERKRAETALKVSKERFKSLIETTSEWIWEVDKNAHYTYVSPKIKELLGYEPKEIYGKTPFDLMSPEEAKKVKTQFQAYLNNLMPFKWLINVNLHRDGHEVILETSGVPVFDEEGKFKGYRGIDRDVTGKIRAEEELRKTKGFLHNIIESMPSALFTLDYEGRITQLNRSAEVLADVGEQEALGRMIWGILPFFSRYKSLLEKIKRKKRAVYLHFESFTELRERYFDISFYPLTTNGVEGIVIRLDDVTEVEKVQRQLVQSQKMESIGMLAGGLAHDFNNVLTGIITTVSLIKYEMESGSLGQNELKEYIDTVDRSGARAAAVVRQLLAISRKNRTRYSGVDLNEAIENVLKICRTSFDKIVTIDFIPFPGRAMIESEQTQIEQILLNLFINGYHAMTIMRESGERPGGTLTIKLEKFEADEFFCRGNLEAEEGGYYRIEIVDTGVGMDSETTTRIFEPFFTTKGHEEGTGLGLSMVYSLVKEHRGFIKINSEVGKGTRLELYIPCFDDERELENAELPLLQGGKSREGIETIFIVDDEEVVRRLAGKILEKSGYTTLKAADGKSGLQIYRDRYREIALVLLDISMPELSGKDIFIEMKRINPEVKVIVCSGFGQDKRVSDLKEMGIKGFLQKPYSLEELRTIVKRVLEEE